MLTTDEQVALMLLTDVSNLLVGHSSLGQLLLHQLGERRATKRWKNRPFVVGYIEHTLVDSKRMDGRFGERCVIPLLFLPEDGDVLLVRSTSFHRNPSRRSSLESWRISAPRTAV
jgi:hypothetical protein